MIHVISLLADWIIRHSTGVVQLSTKPRGICLRIKFVSLTFAKMGELSFKRDQYFKWEMKRSTIVANYGSTYNQQSSLSANIHRLGGKRKLYRKQPELCLLDKHAWKNKQTEI